MSWEKSDTEVNGGRLGGFDFCHFLLNFPLNMNFDGSGSVMNKMISGEAVWTSDCHSYFLP